MYRHRFVPWFPGIRPAWGLVLGLGALLVASTPAAAVDLEGFHGLMEVDGPDRIKVNFHNLPVVVRLAYLKDVRPEARGELEKFLATGREKLRIFYIEELGSDPEGRPYVYLIVNQEIANERLVAKGFADYDTARGASKRFGDRLADAVKTAKKNKLGLWSETVALANPPKPEPKPVEPVSTPSTPDVKPVVSVPVAGVTVNTVARIAELNGSFHHLVTCTHTKRINPGNRIEYASVEAAERAGKQPCWICQAERADKRVFGTSGKGQMSETARVGKLIGLKSDPTYFYSPVSPKLKGVSASDMIGFATVAEAQASGRKPDPYSLRLAPRPGAPGFTAPEKGECIGYAPPYFRPCYRAPADESGLCTCCQGRE